MSDSGQIWRAQAPSNIALIKYMGKSDVALNRPTNTSLSYTLPHLRTIVELLPINDQSDRWERLMNFEGRSLAPIELSEKGRTKFLGHLAQIKERFDVKQNFLVRSANDFASDCGLASSASSFAALTKAALAAVADLSGQKLPSVFEAAELSRQGSGSSCRSFFAPWSIWSGRADSGVRVGAVPELKHVKFIHQAVVVSSSCKEVSSSDAHKRVLSSELFQGRPARAEKRTDALIAALASRNWREAFEITWNEFWDMHALFETSQPSFGYMSDVTIRVLRQVRERTWDAGIRGPLITMDAGPNIHLLHIDDNEGRSFARSITEIYKNEAAGQIQVLTSDGTAQ